MQEPIVFEGLLLPWLLLCNIGYTDNSLALAEVAREAAISCVVHVSSYGVIVAVQSALRQTHSLALHSGW